MKFLIATENAHVRAHLKKLYAPVRLVFVEDIHTYLKYLNTVTYDAVFLDTTLARPPCVNFVWVKHYRPPGRTERNKTTPLFFLTPER